MESVSPPPDRNPTRRILVALVKLVLTLVVLFFLFKQVESQWSQVADYEWQVSPVYLVLSIFAGLLTFFAFSQLWRRIIAGFGHKVSPMKSFRIFYLSNLGRYVPGKVWQLLGIIYLTRREGISPEAATSSFVLVQLFAIPASFLVFVLSSLLEPKILTDRVGLLGTGSAWVAVALIFSLVASLVVRPQWLVGLGNWFLRKLKRPPIQFHIDKRVALYVVVGYCLAWFGYGVAFWLFLKSVIGQADLSLFGAVAAFNAAYQIGYLALFAPGGFGPRELVLGTLMTPFLGPVAPAAALMSRLWAIVVESIAALMALAVRR